MRYFLVLLIFPIIAFCDEPAPATAPGFRKHDLYLGVGWTIAPKTKSKDASFNGVSLPEHKYSDRSGLQLGFDGDYRGSPYIGFSLAFDYTNYPGTEGVPDNLFFLGVGPRFAIPIGDFELWSSLLVGIGLDQFGTTRSSGNGVVINSRDSQSRGFEFSPRIGADYEVNHLMKLRLQFGYSMVSFPYSFDATTTSGTYIGSGSGSIDVSWLTATAGFAWEF